MINSMEFEDGDKLYERALPCAENIAELKRRTKDAGIPTIYVNDNYGRWQSDFKEIVEYIIEEDTRGKPITELLKPVEEDYFVLKPKFSGFFATPLHLLLEHLMVETVILTGVAGNMCVHFTANDAYMRDYKIFVPEDCTASNTIPANEEALHLMRDVLKGSITPSSKLTFKGDTSADIIDHG
ncbi:nicotinamidase-related amidase [Alkalicoccobacillus murimartini]|uniref:Nicotinamidase-related amidase n=2 Tax=Alkalicoccobacillus murimartini TaxID=171685 RepID=A0ABT9YFH8_9BACI|nr:nicotinamidase-related amidase [Alkalicoccobacillus murimartini]